MYQYLVKSGIRASQSKATHRNPAPLTIDALRDGSNPGVPVPLLTAVEQRIRQLSTTGSPTIDEALRRTYLTGGKLLRPRLLIDFAQVWGTPSPTQTVDAAAAVELLHVATLIHDDIVDKADSRRGQPTLHNLVGVDRAIVAGDLLLGIAASIASRLGDESAQVWSDALLSISRAQNLEFDLRFDVDVSAEQMLSYATDKTAALVSAACKLGALLSSANPHQCEAAAGFGLNFGIAFQLVDDLLDLVGDEVAIGKPVWQDVPNGIFTAAVIRGRDTLTGQALTTLRSALEQGDAATVRDLLDHSDVLAAAVVQAESFALSAADAASDGVPIELCEYPVTYVHERLDRFRGIPEGPSGSDEARPQPWAI